MNFPEAAEQEPPPKHHRFVGFFSARIISVLLALPVILLSGWWLFPHLNDRSITIEARTLSLDLRFEETVPTNWPLKDAVACWRLQRGPRAIRQQNAASAPPQQKSSGHDAIAVADEAGEAKAQGVRSSPPCNLSTHEKRDLATNGISWARGSRVILSYGNEDYPVRIFYAEQPTDNNIPAANALPVNSYLLLSKAAASAIGVLRFRAKAIVGDLPVSGTSRQLLSGRFEIWDIPRQNRSPVLTRTGNLLMGDRISVVRQKNSEGVCLDDCEVAGEVVVSFNPDVRAMNVVMHAGSGDDLLRVERIGGTVALVGSGWFDRARKDTLLIAIGSILALLVALSGAGKAVAEFIDICKFKRREAPVQKLPESVRNRQQDKNHEVLESQGDLERFETPSD